MRLVAIWLCVLLTGCGSASIADKQTKQAEEKARGISNAPMPKGWHYASERDRIRNRDVRLATLANDDPKTIIDGSVVLGLQTGKDGGTVIFFRGVRGTTLSCIRDCAVEFKADDKTGAWYGNLTSDGDILLDGLAGEAETILASKTIIVKLNANLGRQFTFHVQGLRWPVN